MKANSDRQYAQIALRLVVNGRAGHPAGEQLDCELLLRIARANRVLLRVAAALEQAGVTTEGSFAEAALKERERACRQIDLIARISRSCDEKGIGYIFAKAFQHYPDAGSDVDMFIVSSSTKTDSLILEGLDSAPDKRGFHHRIAGTANYKISGCDSKLEIHHGRIGHFGETDSFVPSLIERAKKILIGGQYLITPSDEDNIVLQGLSRVYNRLHLRLSDIASVITTIRNNVLDWQYIVSTSRRLGSFHGLSGFLSYAEQIHSEVFGGYLLSRETKKLLLLEGWGRVEFRNGYYRFPAVRVIGRVYLKKFTTLLAAGNIASASRLALLPVAAAESALNKIKRIGQH